MGESRGRITTRIDKPGSRTIYGISMETPSRRPLTYQIKNRLCAVSATRGAEGGLGESVGAWGYGLARLSHVGIYDVI